MRGLFDFLLEDDYEDRKIERYDDDELFVSTCRVSDSERPYETAVSTPEYNKGKIVIVEMYDTEQEAREGHHKWLEAMKNNPPNALTNVSSCGSSEWIKKLGGTIAFERGRKHD